MKCMNCGKEIYDGSKFCFYCGTPTNVQAQANSMQAENNQLVGMDEASAQPLQGFEQADNLYAETPIQTNYMTAEADATGDQMDQQADQWNQPEVQMNQQASQWSQSGAQMNQNQQAGQWSQPGAQMNQQAGQWSQPGAQMNQQAGQWSQPGAQMNPNQQGSQWNQPGAQMNHAGVSTNHTLIQFNQIFSKDTLQDKEKAMSFALGILHLMLLILWFCKTMSMSGILLSYKLSMLQLMPGLLNIMTITLLLAMSGICFIEGAWKKIPLVADISGIITQVWYSGWMIFQKVAGDDIISEGYSLAQVSFTGGGILAIMLSIIALGLHIVKLILANKKPVNNLSVPNMVNYQSSNRQ